MGWSKRDFINQAYAEIGIAAHDFDIQPEQYQHAARILDALMAELNVRGVRVGYVISANAQSQNLDEDSGVRDAANACVYLMLACRLAPTHGKQLNPETVKGAASAYGALITSLANEKPYIAYPHSLPRGAGNKPWRNGNSNFMPISTAEAEANGAVIPPTYQLDN